MHSTFARSFNEHPNSLSLRTLICNTFIEGQLNFLLNIFLVVGMIYSLFKVIIPSVQYFGSAASNSRSRASKTSRLKLKREVPRTEKRFKIALMFSGRRRRSRKEWIYESKCQVRDRLHAFAGFFFPLNPSATTVYARSTFCIQPAFYSQSAVCILQSVCILPLVFSLQFAVRSLRVTLTGFEILVAATTNGFIFQLNRFI